MRVLQLKESIIGYDLEVGPNYFIIGLIEMKSGEITKISFRRTPSAGGTMMERLLVTKSSSNSSQRVHNAENDGVNQVYDSLAIGISNKLIFDMLDEIMQIKWLVSFNGSHYDDVILSIALYEMAYASQNPRKLLKLFERITSECYNTSVHIIEYGQKYSYKNEFFKQSLDLKKISRTEKSLKMIGGSLNYPIIMDFPVNPHEELEELKIEIVQNYLTYDLEILQLLYQKLSPELNLRKGISLKYGVNVMNEDRPGIANELFSNMYCKEANLTQVDLSKLRHKVQKTPRVQIGSVVSKVVSFRTNEMKDYIALVSKEIIRCDKDKITIDLPPIKIGNTTYTLGAGGLHSQDGPGIFVADRKFIYRDADVSSYYPRLIIENQLYPSHLSPTFYKLVEKIMIERLTAKKSGDMVTADTLKIVVNSIFGKTGEENSWFYSAEVFLGTTLNGQLYLLMLIEELELHGFEVISANTDGIITKIERGREHIYDTICNRWMRNTKMELEFVDYDLYARLSVNSYMAVTPNGKVKTKDEFNYMNEIDKSAIATVIPMVMIEYLKEKYIYSRNHSIRKLVLDRLVHGSIHEFMWTHKPADKDWKNVIYTVKNTIEIPDTVRFAICKNSYPHKVKLFKYKKSIPNYKKKMAYIAGEYSAIANNFTETVYHNSMIPHIKLDYYVDEIVKKLALIETGNVQSKLSLF